MTNDKSLRQHLVALLDGGHAYTPIAKILANIPPRFCGEIPKGLPHSAWMLLEHLRIAQRDILDFSRNPKYVAPKWPDDYWPKSASPPSAAAWNKSVKSFQDDLEAMKTLVSSGSSTPF